MRYEYLISLVLLLLIAVCLKFKYKISVFNSTKEIVTFYSVIFVIGTIWDNFAVWRGHWFYPGKGIIPIEDYIFAIVTSYTVLVLYKTIQKVYQ